MAIAVYGLAGIWVALLGQAGMTVRGAYDVLVSMGISKVVGGTALMVGMGAAVFLAEKHRARARMAVEEAGMRES